MIKTIKYFTLYIFLTLITCNVYAEEQVKNKPQEEKKTNAFLRFANEYLITDYNPIFKEQTNMLGIVYTDSFGDHKEDNKKRHLHNIVLQILSLDPKLKKEENKMLRNIIDKNFGEIRL